MSEKKVKMEAIHSIQQGRVLHLPGKTFETTPKEAKRLMSKGVAKIYRENEDVLFDDSDDMKQEEKESSIAPQGKKQEETSIAPQGKKQEETSIAPQGKKGK